MKKITTFGLIITLTLMISACTQEKAEDVETRNLPGLTEDLTIYGEIVNKRDHDFSIQIKNEKGTSDWISFGNEVKTTSGETLSFSEILVRQEVTIQCEDAECEFGESLDIN